MTSVLKEVAATIGYMMDASKEHQKEIMRSFREFGEKIRQNGEDIVKLKELQIQIQRWLQSKIKDLEQKVHAIPNQIDESAKSAPKYVGSYSIESAAYFTKGRLIRSK